MICTEETKTIGDSIDLEGVRLSFEYESGQKSPEYNNGSLRIWIDDFEINVDEYQYAPVSEKSHHEEKEVVWIPVPYKLIQWLKQQARDQVEIKPAKDEYDQNGVFRSDFY
jgi:hypothetical protein